MSRSIVERLRDAGAFAHEGAYWRIDDNVVYEVATMELPALGLAMERIFKQLT